MKNIAVISDIHGNSVALRKILEDCKNRNIDEYLFPGDIVNDLPFGNETLDLARNLNSKFVRGNKEEYLTEYHNKRYTWDNLQFKNTIFMHDELTKDNLDFVLNMPFELDLEYEGVTFKMVHATPDSVSKIMYRKEEQMLDRYTKELQEDVLLFGHTHEKAWFDTINDKLVIQAGCSGVSPEYESQAEYLILHIENGNVQIEQCLVDYDAEEIKEKIIDSGILDLDQVLMRLTYNAITRHGITRHNFWKDCIIKHRELDIPLVRDDAEGIFKHFKLYDNKIWLEVYDKYKKDLEF